MLITGLANIAARRVPDIIIVLAAMIGNLSILIIGALLAWSDPSLLLQPQTVVLLALGLILSIFRLSASGARRR